VRFSMTEKGGKRFTLPVAALTSEERAEFMRGRCGRFSAEERADAAKHGVRLPATAKEKLF